MSSIGFFELLMIFIVGLLVIGPEQLPSVVRKLMMWRRYLNNQMTEFKNSLEHEVGLDEMRQSMHNADIMQDLKKGEQALKDLKQDIRQMEADNPITEIDQELSSVIQSAKD